MPIPTLIIGYGNMLRSDDGLGPRLAQAVADWQLPQVRSLILHGLVPEIADSLAECERVLFADAGTTAKPFEVLTLTARGGFPAGSHASDPNSLLALTLALHGRCPEAWLLVLPSENFDLGETLSVTAQRGLDAALAWLGSWLQADADRAASSAGHFRSEVG